MSLDRALLLSLEVLPPFCVKENSGATEDVSEREEAEDREHFSKILMNQLNFGSGCRASDQSITVPKCVRQPGRVSRAQVLKRPDR